MAVLFISGTTFTGEMRVTKMSCNVVCIPKVQTDDALPYRPEGFDSVQDAYELHAMLVLFVQLFKF